MGWGSAYDDFGVNRLESGLSIVIPYFRDDELSFESIAPPDFRVMAPHSFLATHR